MTPPTFRDGPAGRRLAIIAAWVIQAVYFSFRAATLNFDGPTAAVYSLLVFTAELALGVSFALILFELWRPAAPAEPESSNRAATDVILVVRDEELSLVRTSLAACERLDAAHQTLVLDCSHRPEVRAAAEEAGVGYFQPAPTGATRGQALDAALPRLAGELIAVFDAGTIPETNFLRRTTSRFADATLAAVQTTIIAPAPLTESDARRVDLTPRYAEPLFRQRQVGRNHWNAAMLMPSAFVIRRSALDAVGAFGAEESETLRTTLRLHRAGWKTEYLDEPLCIDFTSMDAGRVLGANAESKAGDVAALLDERPVFDHALSFPQRLCYGSTLFRSCAPLLRAGLLLAPLPALSFGLFPASSGWEVAAAAAALVYYLAASFMRQFLTSGRVRLAAYELNAVAAVWSTARAVVGVFVGRQSKRRDSPGQVPSGSATPHLIFAALGAAAMFWAWLGPTFGVTTPGVLMIPTLFALWNAALAMVAVERILAKWERRRHERRAALLSVQYDVPGEANLGGLGLAFDLSESGLGLVVFHPFNAGQSLFMTLEGPEGRMRLQGEVRSVRRIGGGITPSLERPAAYRVGVQLTRATPQQRDLLLHWSALHAAREVNRGLHDDSFRRLFSWSPLRRGRQRLFTPLLLGGEDESDPWGCVTSNIGPTSFHVFSRQPLEKDAELRVALATPFGIASGWVRVENDAPLADNANAIRSQQFAFTIWDNGSEAIIRRMTTPRRRDGSLNDALSPSLAAPKPPLRTYAVAAAVWFLLAAPLLSMSFFHAHAAEILLGKLEAPGVASSLAELDELESFSRDALARGNVSTNRLEQLYDVLERGGRRREATRLAGELSARQPNDASWRLRWAHGLAAAGLHGDAEERFKEVLASTIRRDASDLASIHAARGRNFAAAGNWAGAADAFVQAVFLIPDNNPLRRELAAALIRAGRAEEARDFTDLERSAPAKTPPAPKPTSPKIPPSIAVAPPNKTPPVKRPPQLDAQILRDRVGNAAQRTASNLGVVLTTAARLDDWWGQANIRAWPWEATLTALETDRLHTAGTASEARAACLQALETLPARPELSPLRDRLLAAYFAACMKSPPSPGLLDEARRESARLLTEERGSIPVLAAAAQFFEQAGDAVEAVALLDRAHLMAPRDPSIGQRFAAALEKVGEYDRAAAVLRTLLGDR